MPALSPVLTFIYALVFCYIGDLFATFVQMPAFGLPALMTSDSSERVSISTWTAALSIVGPMAVSVMRFFVESLSLALQPIPERGFAELSSSSWLS
jgi:Na+/melibiose symporter-like transporter